MRHSNIPVSGPLKIEKVIKFAKELGYEKFQGNSEWLEKFMKRHQWVTKIICGG